MAAPTATPRVTPTGIWLEKGYQALVTLALDTNIELWEKTVQPPGLDGGEKIDTTTQHNTTYRTFAPRALVTGSDCKFKCAYDPTAYTSILAVINEPTTITVTFPDGSTVAFYGYLQAFQPDAMEEGKQPEADVNIVCTNYDHTAHTEAGPTITSVAGT